MAGWLQAWSHCIGAQAVPGAPLCTSPTLEHEMCPAQLQSGVTMLLAGMVLLARQEMLA